MAKSVLSGPTNVVVIGLGRFGSSVAIHLTRLGHGVLAIERREDMVQSGSEELTYVVQADSTDPIALRRLGVENFGHATVAIGEDVEASVFTVLALTAIGCRDIWAKALQERHGRLLARTGAHHVIYPEAAMVSGWHMITGKVIDFIEFDDGFAIVKTAAPKEALDLPLGEFGLRSKYGVTVVGLKRPGENFTYTTADTIVQGGDPLIVSGKTEQVERFASFT